MGTKVQDYDQVFRTIVGIDHILFFRRDVVDRLHHDFEDLSRSFVDTRQKTKNRTSHYSSLDFYSQLLN